MLPILNMLNQIGSTEVVKAYGLPALIAELAEEGISQNQVLREAGLSTLSDDLTIHERTALFGAAQALSRRPQAALLAGQRQRISYYGAYGYALATSRTMREAVGTGRAFLHLSGTLLQISFREENGEGVWLSHQPESLGPLLPFVAEYWRSSLNTLFSNFLGSRFPSISMSFPYKAPRHASLYREIFRCPINFDADVMEWRFDAAILDQPNCHADPFTVELCEHYYKQFFQHSGASSEFERQLLRTCLDQRHFPKVDAGTVSRAMSMSLRTFYRRLKQEGVSFQGLIDRLRCSVAIEYLRNTQLTVDEISSKCGYQDVANFRKAFKRWTGNTPSSIRGGQRSATR